MPVSSDHLLITLEHLVEHSTRGYVPWEVVDSIDDVLPAYAGLITSDLCKHAQSIGLISCVANRTKIEGFFVHAAALDLLGLDATEVYGDCVEECSAVVSLYDLYTREGNRENGRVWRAAASVMLLLDTELSSDRIHALSNRSIADSSACNRANTFWSLELQFGLQLALAEGFIEPASDGLSRLLDHQLLEAGRTWLTGEGAAIASSVSTIELRGVL